MITIKLSAVDTQRSFSNCSEKRFVWQKIPRWIKRTMGSWRPEWTSAIFQVVLLSIVTLGTRNLEVYNLLKLKNGAFKVFGNVFDSSYSHVTLQYYHVVLVVELCPNALRGIIHSASNGDKKTFDIDFVFWGFFLCYFGAAFEVRCPQPNYEIKVQNVCKLSLISCQNKVKDAALLSFKETFHMEKW